MVADDPLRARVRRRAERAHRAQRVAEQVGLVDGVDALQQAGDPLQAEPDVDVVLRQRAQRAVDALLVDDEDVVAELQPAPSSWM